MNLASMVIELPAMQYSIPGSKGTGSLTLSNLDKSDANRKTDTGDGQIRCHAMDVCRNR